MKTIFYLAGGLLTLSGILHLVRLFMFSGLQGILPAVLVGLFGVVALAVGVGLIRQRDAAVRWGIILPVVGLVVTLIGLGSSDSFTTPIIALNLIVIVLVVTIMLAGRGLLRRVQ